MATALPTIGHLVRRLDQAGADRLAADVANALTDRFNFVFLSLGPTGSLGQQLHGQNHRVIQLRHTPLSPVTPLRIRRAIHRHGIGVLHTHHFTTHRLACMARVAARGPTILMTDHVRDTRDRAHAWRALHHRLTLRPTDAIAASADYIRDALRDYDGLDARRISVIPNGIDPDRFDHANQPRRAAARKLMGYTDEEHVVMQVARFAPEKDHTSAISAFARVHDQLPSARLVLVGDGPTRPAMEQLAWDRGVADHTLFMGVRNDVDTLLAGADAFLLTSLSEGLSPTVLEAMASRLPVIATSVGGNTQAVVHGQTGLLCPAEDIAALAHNLLVVLRSPDLCHRMGEAGRQRVLNHFTRRHMLDAYAELYQQLWDEASVGR